MRDTVELGAFGIYLLEKFFSKRERADLFRTWGGLSSMLPKGGEAIWGNITHAPDDRHDIMESYGPMLTFRCNNNNNNNNNSDSDNKNVTRDVIHKYHTCNSGVKFLHKYTNPIFNNMLARNYSYG